MRFTNVQHILQVIVFMITIYAEALTFNKQ